MVPKHFAMMSPIEEGYLSPWVLPRFKAKIAFSRSPIPLTKGSFCLLEFSMFLVEKLHQIPPHSKVMAAFGKIHQNICPQFASLIPPRHRPRWPESDGYPSIHDGDLMVVN